MKNGVFLFSLAKLRRSSRERKAPAFHAEGRGFETLGMRHVARRQVSSCLTVSLDTGLSHITPGISIDDAFYPWWDLDVLSNERRLTGECRCRYDSRAAEDVLGFIHRLLRCHITCPLSGPRSFNVNPCHIPLGTDKNYYSICRAKMTWNLTVHLFKWP